MTTFHKTVLQKVLVEVVETMNPDGIVNHLYAEGFLSDRDLADIKQPPHMNDRVQTLILQLKRKPDGAYDCLLSALAKDGQGPVADIIRKKECEYAYMHPQITSLH